MFLSERELKELFWKNYNYNYRAIKYQFESPIREGCADLITIEKYQENIQINAFEFKLDNVKKALLQAKGNLPFVHKSWMVFPHEKETLLKEKYQGYIRAAGIGVIVVEEGGRWKVIFKPKYQNTPLLNQEIARLLLDS